MQNLSKGKIMTEKYVLRIPARLEGMDTMLDELEYEYRDGCNHLTMRKQF
jgi:hypothetical protein